MTAAERVAGALERIADFFDWQRATQERHEAEARMSLEQMRREQQLAAQVAEAVPSAPDVMTETLKEALRVVKRLHRLDDDE